VRRAERCFVCSALLEGDDRLVLVRGRVREEYCSELCLRQRVRRQRAARTRTQLRWLLGAALAVSLAAGGDRLWHRYRQPQPESIASGAPDEVRPVVAAPAPIFYGPAWPPTDADWIAAFDVASGMYPLPGPVRRPPAADGRIFGPEPPRDHPARCRAEGVCGVDLGGGLWGEHVYAVLDGVVDWVHRNGNEEGGGQYVRIAHFGGMVFTQYFHLAAIPRRFGRGTRVQAGDVVGLLGDTGLEGKDRHLTFTLSVRPSSEFPEVYWDPRPWMARWPLRLPPHGTVAGFVSAQSKVQ
jgi:murein DD-endopeptidase MepM/ murein hydrolase activator NlpD